MSEQWNQIEGLPVGYQISDKGKVRIDYGDHYEDGKISRNSGFLAFCAMGKQFMIHQLVAKAFVPKPASKGRWYIVHVDGDRCNNESSNLIWVDGTKNLKPTLKHIVVDETSKILFSNLTCAASYFGISTSILQKYVDTATLLCGHRFRTGTPEDLKNYPVKIMISLSGVEEILSTLKEFDLQKLQEEMRKHVVA